MLQISAGKIDIAAEFGPAGRNHQVGLLAFEQPDRTILGIAESFARTGNQVDPRLHRRRDAEVIDRHREHHCIRRLEFTDQFVRQREMLSLGIAAIIRIGEIGADPGLIDQRQAVGQIAVCNGGAAGSVCEHGDKRVGEVARNGPVSPHAGIDTKNVKGLGLVRHGVVPLSSDVMFRCTGYGIPRARQKEAL